MAPAQISLTASSAAPAPSLPIARAAAVASAATLALTLCASACSDDTTTAADQGDDGEAETGTLNARFWLRPLQKLDLDLFFNGRERNYDNPRDGYRYIRGDGSSQPAAFGLPGSTVSSFSQATILPNSATSC